MVANQSSGFRRIYGLSKILAIVVGGPLTVLAGMATTGLLTENGWIRLVVALLFALGVPLTVADRLLPKDDPTRGRGVPTEVLSVFYSVVALLFFGVFASQTGPWSRLEGDRQTVGMVPLLARAPYLLSRTALEPPAPTPTETESASTTTTAADEQPEPDSGQARGADVVSDGGVDAGMDAGPTTDDSAATTDTELSSADLFSRWSDSVVSISVGHGGGTGFVLDPDGTIATNHHVLGDSPTGVKVKLHGDKYAEEVWFLWSNAEADLALIQVTTDETLKGVQLADSDTVRVGERAISIGNPLGLEHTLTEGIVSARRVFQGRRMIQMSTPISPGNSGGPLFRGNGQVLGISTATLGFMAAQNLNLAIPVNELKEALERDHPDRKRIGGGAATAGGTW